MRISEKFIAKNVKSTEGSKDEELFRKFGRNFEKSKLKCYATGCR